MPRASCDSMHADSPGTSLMKSSRQEIRWVRGIGEAERGLGAEDERGDTRRGWCSTVPLWCWRGTAADRTSGRIDGAERVRTAKRTRFACSTSTPTFSSKTSKSTQHVRDIPAHILPFFPPESAEQSTVLLVYDPLSVNASPSPDEKKRHLEEDAADVKSQTIAVEKRWHDAVVGRGGTTLNAIIGEDKTLSIKVGAEANDPSGEDVIVLRGASGDVDRAAKEILAIIENAKNDGISSKFDIEREFVGRIVGAQGAGVNKIRDQLGVKVDVSDEIDEKAKDSGKKKRLSIKGHNHWSEGRKMSRKPKKESWRKSQPLALEAQALLNQITSSSNERTSSSSNEWTSSNSTESDKEHAESSTRAPTSTRSRQAARLYRSPVLEICSEDGTFRHQSPPPLTLTITSAQSSKLYWKPRSPDFGLAYFLTPPRSSLQLDAANYTQLPQKPA
ncbi:hypothetical protein DFH06DRAFT_1327730 [Mycena polygramma]|nr:hypothetical protein DFH06DRAFT_1327730 [Mycena polygramma]